MFLLPCGRCHSYVRGSSTALCNRYGYRFFLALTITTGTTAREARDRGRLPWSAIPEVVEVLRSALSAPWRDCVLRRRSLELLRSTALVFLNDFPTTNTARQMDCMTLAALAPSNGWNRIETNILYSIYSTGPSTVLWCVSWSRSCDWRVLYRQSRSFEFTEN